jgi:membrane-associated phospholipid phosphatase
MVLNLWIENMKNKDEKFGSLQCFALPVRTARALGIAVFAGFVLLGGFLSRASADEVIRWNEVATDAATANKVDPLTESRIFAILHIAIHDAVNAVQPRYQSYLPKESSALVDASLEAAVAGAAHEALVALIPAGKESFDIAFEKSLGQVPDSPRKEAGVEIGRAAAAAILAVRETDGANRTIEYTAGTEPGQYCPTPPDFTPAFMSHWGKITPFVLQSSAQFRCPEPPPINSEKAFAEIEEVRAIGGSKSATRTAEQSEIARFWYESSPRGWNRIAREVAAPRGFDAWENARLFALVNLALADGYIAGFEDKYHCNYWRPVTAIRHMGDREWLSYLPTPPVPDYPSTHTVVGAAAATAIARFFGTDFISFSMTSGEPYPDITRKFWSFSEAARENGASRILCGIHFASAVRAGYIQGEQVGDWVFQNALRPVKPQPVITTSQVSEPSHRRPDPSGIQ